jgi:RHS repeat-associated protein
MEFDEENSMYYFHARYYNPPTFISRDPLFEKYPFMSAYAYAMNNPLKYIDPTGMEGEVTDLVAADKARGTNHTEQLTQSLSEITGLNVTTENRDGKTFLSYAKDADGNPVINTDENGNSIGSEIARGMLRTLIDDSQTINIGRRDGKGSAGGGNEIGLDIRQIEGFMKGVKGGLNKETMGYGMTFLHEFLHTNLGGSLSDEPYSSSNPGPVASRMNIIRSELNAQGENYGQRMNYQSYPIGNQSYIGFNKVSAAYIRNWQAPSVGKFIAF